MLSDRRRSRGGHLLTVSFALFPRPRVISLSHSSSPGICGLAFLPGIFLLLLMLHLLHLDNFLIFHLFSACLLPSGAWTLTWCSSWDWAETDPSLLAFVAIHLPAGHRHSAPKALAMVTFQSGKGIHLPPSCSATDSACL